MSAAENLLFAARLARLLKSERRLLAEPRIERARYDRRTGQVTVHLDTGCSVVFPPCALAPLARANDAELAELAIAERGCGLRWPAVDVGYSLPALLAAVFDLGGWMVAEAAGRAGRTSSPAKAAAARANGRRGGRPRRRRWPRELREAREVREELPESATARRQA